MARLLSWPIDVGLTSITPSNGPIAIGAGGSTSLSNYSQTVSSAFFAWEFEISFQPMKARLARQVRGWTMAMHGGANATRYKVVDGDRMTPDEAGLSNWTQTVRWQGGESWSNGHPWGTAYPTVKLDADVAQNGTIIKLANTHWGHLLGYGDWIGFGPFYFGAHMVTEVLDNGRYRVFPPLRKGFTTANEAYATAHPVIALRLNGADAASLPREAAFIEGAAMQFVEVLDYDVRDYFGD